MPTKKTGKGGDWDTRPNPFQNNGNRAGTPSLADVSGLGLALDKVLRQGCAFMFGHTRDGGAVVLTVLDGAERHRTYCSNQAELDAAFEGIDFVYSQD